MPPCPRRCVKSPLSKKCVKIDTYSIGIAHMPFRKGEPKPAGSGRRKGDSKAETVRAICERLGCCPFEGMAQLAMNPKTKPELRGKMYAELGQYLAPKLRAVEHSGPGGESIKFRIEDVRAYAQSIADGD